MNSNTVKTTARRALVSDPFANLRYEPRRSPHSQSAKRIPSLASKAYYYTMLYSFQLRFLEGTNWPKQ